jgi:hypothetical protein
MIAMSACVTGLKQPLHAGLSTLPQPFDVAEAGRGIYVPVAARPTVKDLTQAC